MFPVSLGLVFNKEYDVLISTDLRGLKYLDKNNYKILEINTPK